MKVVKLTNNKNPSVLASNSFDLEPARHGSELASASPNAVFIVF